MEMKSIWKNNEILWKSMKSIEKCDGKKQKDNGHQKKILVAHYEKLLRFVPKHFQELLVTE